MCPERKRRIDSAFRILSMIWYRRDTSLGLHFEDDFAVVVSGIGRMSRSVRVEQG